MKIYLARVREQAEGGLFVEREEHPIQGQDYIAISHVWGTPETIQLTEIKGIGQVPLSPGKRDLLSVLRRPDVCGDKWFWMDLFCIDQTETALISISDQLMSIPAIYKYSQVVKVLLEYPICQDWQATALRVLANPGAYFSEEYFREEELRHSRKCPHLLIFDPWFERLWTRQEGLYGMVLDVVVLNPIMCKRTHVSSGNRNASWGAEGIALGKRNIADMFLHDKSQYHGLGKDSVTAVSEFRLYTDFVYQRRLDISKLNGSFGPDSAYSPVIDAWRSARITTKAPDYILAVFPDIAGYKAPPLARKMSFKVLLADALNQPPIRSRFWHIAKVPRGLAVTHINSLRDSRMPWIVSDPENIGEAYDTCVLWPRESPVDSSGERLTAATTVLNVVNLDLTTSNFRNLKDLCALTVDMRKQIMLISLSGPCNGTTRGVLGVLTQQERVHQYLLHNLTTIAVAQHLTSDEMEGLELRSAGVIPSDESLDVDDEIFGKELERFLVCMLCGTSLRVADEILVVSSLRVFSTPIGRLLGLMRREVTHEGPSQKLILLLTNVWHMEGFLIGLRTDAGVFVVGKTAVPSDTVFDVLMASQG